MGKKLKREQKIRDNTRNVSLEDFEWLINQYGYIKTGGNHQKARIGNMTITYKKENPIKSHYVEQILDMIDKLK
jgi:hypothetical protein